MKVKNRLNELTKDLYLKYKKQRFSDTQIQRLFNAGPNTFTNWKKENRIPVGLNISTLEAIETYFPDEIERMKKDFSKYEKSGWTMQQIAEEMKISEKKLCNSGINIFRVKEK